MEMEINNQVGVEEWFPTIFYYARDVVSNTENKKLIAEMLSLKETTPNGSAVLPCDVYTSYGTLNILELPAFKNLLSVFDNHINSYLLNIRAHEKLSCREAWFNITGPKQYQEEHIHIRSKLSLVYYCCVPKGSAPTTFKSPYVDINPLYADFTNQIPTTYTAEVGKLVIFPSYVPHFVSQGTNMKDRITVSANYN